MDRDMMERMDEGMAERERERAAAAAGGVVSFPFMHAMTLDSAW
jgi:hypothetical protein